MMKLMAMAVVLFVAVAGVSAQVVLLNDDINITRQPDAGGSWNVSTVEWRADGSPDAAQSGNIFLHTVMPGPLDAGAIVLRTGIPVADRFTVGDINPNGATISFWYRTNYYINLAVGLATADWNDKPASGMWSGTGGDAVVVGGFTQLTNVTGEWAQKTITITGFEQDMDPTAVISRLAFLSVNGAGTEQGWVGSLNGEGQQTYMDIDNVVWTNGTGGVSYMPGDANKDGYVNDDDLSLLLSNWRGEGRIWDHGDFNGDGVVNDDDLSLLLSNWRQGTPPGGNMVPEPATLSVLGLGAMALIRRRK